MSSEYLTFDDVNIVPKYSDVLSRSEVSLVTKFTKEKMIDIPLVAAPMDTICDSDMACELWRLGGVGVIHRFMQVANQVVEVDRANRFINERLETATIAEMSQMKYKMPVIAAAIGVTDDYLDRLIQLVEAGANVILIDVAHGNHLNVKSAMHNCIRFRADRNLQFDIIAGNVATYEGAQNLAAWGVEALRVGIGGGSVCETRIRTGVGVPQISAVKACSINSTIPIISDGGIRYIGDVAKAIVAGADTVMLGNLFAGTDEAPGDVQTSGQWPNKILHKLYRGSASESMKIAVGQEKKNVEGTAKMVLLKGPVKYIVSDILDGLRSAMSYVGAQNIPQLQGAELIRISQAGMYEGLPHLL
jgi:IMP dehydrogenase